MPRSFIVLFIQLLPLFVMAQQDNVFSNLSNTFKGSILDKTENSPIPFATIFIATAKEKYISDSMGNFRITNLPNGKYLCKITCNGFTTLLIEISIPGKDVFYPIALESQLEQIIVTAVTGATKIRKTPLSINIVSQKEMNQTTSTNIIDALLKSVPGISAITTGPNISKPFIRGLGYNRVLTLYDGIRQEGQQWGDEHGIEIDNYGINKAEIVKGPASLLYGSDAIAGVVNLIPEKPVDTEGEITGDITTEYHSNNGMIGNSLHFQSKNKTFGWSARASLKSAMNYQNLYDQRVYNTGFKENNITLMTGWENIHNKTYLHLTLYDNLQEIPDGSRDSVSRSFTYQVNESGSDDIKNRPLVSNDKLSTYLISPLHQHIQHYRVYLKGIYSIRKGELSTHLGFQQNKRREFNHPRVTNQAGLFVVLNTINYETTYNFQNLGGLRYTFGINGMYQVNQNKDATDFPIPDYQLFDLGSFVLVKKELNKTVITGGFRLDNRHIQWQDFYTRKESTTGFSKQVFFPDTTSATVNFISYNKTFNGFSGSLGFVFNPSTSFLIKANLSSGYRSPSIPEIGSDGLDPGAHIYYIGNRNFIPETNIQADIGFFVNYPDVEANIELFNNQINNYIFFQKLFDANGQPLEIVPGNFTYQYKQGSARIYGIETNISIHPKAFPGFTLQNNLSLITGLNTDNESLKILGNDAKYLPLIPPLRTVSRLRINIFQKKQFFNDCFLKTEIETNATQNKFYAVDNTETQTPGYTLLNLGAGISFVNRKNKTICQFFINVNNLFNIAYQSHQNRLKYFEYYSSSADGHSGVYNMGRNIAVKAIFTW